jgi:transcriptional regulator GlxA family with amidase domain
MAETERFVFFLLPEFSHLAFSCAVEPLRIANLISGDHLYTWTLAAADGTGETCSNGSVTLVDRSFEAVQRQDRLFVLSGVNVRAHIGRPLLAALRRERARGARIGALCSGAWVLAEAGFLTGVRTAIHWDWHDSFMEAFPDVALVRNVFVADEKFVTAAGGTATADLMIHLIGERHGRSLASAVADQMVYNAVREPTAEQRISLQARHGMRNPHLARAIQLMADTIEAPLSPAEIAQEVGISTRQLERIFGRHLNCSPKKYSVDMRLQKARHLLLQTEKPVTEIALACGFSSSTHFARVFRAQFGITPAMQRDRIT